MVVLCTSEFARFFVRFDVYASFFHSVPLSRFARVYAFLFLLFFLPFPRPFQHSSKSERTVLAGLSVILL